MSNKHFKRKNCTVLERLTGYPYLALQGYENSCYKADVEGAINGTGYVGIVSVSLTNPVNNRTIINDGVITANLDGEPQYSLPTEMPNFGTTETRRIEFLRGVVDFPGGTLEISETILYGGQAGEMAQQIIVGGTGLYEGASGYGNVIGINFGEPAFMKGEICLGN